MTPNFNRFVVCGWRNEVYVTQNLNKIKYTPAWSQPGEYTDASLIKQERGYYSMGKRHKDNSLQVLL